MSRPKEFNSGHRKDTSCMYINKKMSVFVILLAVAVFCLIGCASKNDGNARGSTGTGTGNGAGSVSRNASNDTQRNYDGNINSNDGSMDGGTGSMSGSNIGLDGAVRDMTDAAGEMYKDVAHGVENGMNNMTSGSNMSDGTQNFGVNSNHAGGNTTANY